jgi:hypothetical protein
MLAKGGFMVEKIAKLRHPDGVDMGVDRPHEEAFRATLDALKPDKVMLFEATLISNGKLARVDILRKRGNVFDLVEVKATSYDSQENRDCQADGYLSLFRNKDATISQDWVEYLEDVAFQVYVLRELFPDAVVHPFLCMPDTSKVTRIDNLYSQFRLRRELRPGQGGERIIVEFTGDLEELRRDDFLTEEPVAAEVDYLMEEVKGNAKTFAASLEPRLQKVVVPLSTKCRDCEYAVEDEIQSGFRECWGRLADVQPHILDLYRAGQVSGGNGITVNDLIRDGKVCLFDVEEESLRKEDGSLGSYGARQLIQIEHTRSNTEWVSDKLKAMMEQFEYPLRFIDFETTALAVPYHSGMGPYEPVAFQWSCHTVGKPGAEPIHSEWINVEDAFPNFEFARSLMKQIGTTGTVFRYAPHETTILRRIRRQMELRRERDDELAAWLNEMSQKDRIVDMYLGMTLKHYYHPLMKGINTIKQVLEAIWRIDPQLRARYPEYFQKPAGQILSPYQALPSLEIQGNPVVVADGTGAMRAYEAMMYGLERDDVETRRRWRDLLLQYCKLDTLAMVMLWQYWWEITH